MRAAGSRIGVEAGPEEGVRDVRRALQCALAFAGAVALVGTSSCAPAAPQEARPEPGALPTLRESHTIGCDACEGPEALRALDVGLMDDGTVLVLNEFEPFVRIFDPAGELVRTVGREGEGPGEMQLPGYLWLDGDGSFRVMDAGPGRLVGYGPAGEPLEALRYPMGMQLVPSGARSSGRPRA